MEKEPSLENAPQLHAKNPRYHTLWLQESEFYKTKEVPGIDPYHISSGEMVFTTLAPLQDSTFDIEYGMIENELEKHGMDPDRAVVVFGSIVPIFENNKPTHTWVIYVTEDISDFGNEAPIVEFLTEVRKQGEMKNTRNASTERRYPTIFELTNGELRYEGHPYALDLPKINDDDHVDWFLSTNAITLEVSEDLLGALGIYPSREGLQDFE